jgi:hypothetical protein
VICTRAREKKYVKDEKDDIQITIDVTLVNNDDKQTCVCCVGYLSGHFSQMLTVNFPW